MEIIDTREGFKTKDYEDNTLYEILEGYNPLGKGVSKSQLIRCGTARSINSFIKKNKKIGHLICQKVERKYGTEESMREFVEKVQQKAIHKELGENDFNISFEDYQYVSDIARSVAGGSLSYNSALKSAVDAWVWKG